MAVTAETKTVHRNPGPTWGYRVLVFAERVLPGPAFRAAFWLGTAIGALLMRQQRHASAQYLELVWGRPPKWNEVVAHFHAFSRVLIRILQVSRGDHHAFEFAPGGEGDFLEVTRQPEPIIYGTFHLGHGDLLGYFVTKMGRPVSMVRLRVGNSDDTVWMEKRFGGAVRFIWVDKPENMLFALRDAIEAGHSLAIKCDRVEGARKVERFTFLGRERVFPFTIYWLSLLFSIPVVFSFGLEKEPGVTQAWCSPSFRPDPAASRPENLELARAHFRDVLAMVEGILREHPYAWFNFGPWNEEESAGGAA